MMSISKVLCLFLVVIITGTDARAGGGHQNKKDGEEHWLDEEIIQIFYDGMHALGIKITDDEIQKEIDDFRRTGNMRPEGLTILIDEFGEKKINKYIRRRQGGSKRDRRAAMYPTSTYWEQGIVVYRFDDEYPETDETKANVLGALSEFERVTCVRFVEYTSTIHAELGLGHTTTLSFGAYGGGCWAYAGRTNSEFQEIAVCGGSATVHEIVHSLGSHHEELRSDANTILQFYIDNIDPDDLFEFEPENTDNRVPYSLSSQMQYTRKFGSLDGNNTMIPYDKDMEYLFGEGGSFLDFRDAEALNLGYQCKDIHCPNFIHTCANEGYVGYVEDACQCVCPSGLSGDTCQESATSSGTASLSWPQDGFSLPMSIDGCPAGFSTGTRKQSMVSSNKLKKFPTLNLPEDSAKNKYFIHHFCVAEPGTFSGTDGFPAGSYCIYRTGGSCPDDFSKGYIDFDDLSSSHANFDNYEEGSVPDGNFDGDSYFKYCCRNDKATDVPIQFPSSEPFQLLVGPDSDNCQEIEDMSVVKGSFGFQPETINDSDFIGLHPNIQSYYVNKDLIVISYCYYEPRATSSSCGGIYELTEENPTLTISSPNYPADYNNGERCYWTVTAPEDKHMSISFTHFDINSADTSTCDEDSLEIRHISLVNEGAKYCGADFSRPLVTYDSYAMLVLETNSADAASGFEATISILEDNDFRYALDYNGRTYSGDMDVTQRSEPCLFWDEVKHCPFSMYTNKAVLGPHNYCRNPTKALRPWCYVDINCQSDVCNIIGDINTDSGTTEPSGGGAACPENYEQFGSSCYRSSTEKQSFNNAEDMCVSEGGHLVSINSAAEEQHVETYLTDTGNTYYIGLEKVSSVWVWFDGSDTTNYGNWYSGVGTKTCGMFKWLNSAWLWDDVGCSYTKYYICEIPAVVESGTTSAGAECDSPQMTNAVLTGSAESSYLEGESVTYSCNGGGDVTRTCMSNGEWSGHDRMCGGSECGTPATMTYANIITGTVKSSYQEGEYITYKCDAGTNGEEVTRTCMSNGDWSGHDRMCGACPTQYQELVPGSCFLIPNVKRSYTDAVAFCEKDGGSLVKLDSATKENALIGILTEDKYIIGLNDKDSEGNHEWQDGTSASYTNWAPASYLNGLGYDCVAERLIDGSYMWATIQCSGSKYFICEVNLVGGYCDDTRDDCAAILIHKPNMCSDDPIFANSDCKASCGNC